MAKVHLGLGGIHSISGSAGDKVFKTYGDETIMSSKPDMSGVVWTERQIAWRAHFAKGIAYAHVAMEDAELLSFYKDVVRRSRKKKKVPFRVAVSDFLKAPVVRDIDASKYTGAAGGVISIDATDNVHVASLTVRLTDGAGRVLEEGPAERDIFFDWHYTVKRSASSGLVRVEATASDLPGGTHTLVRDIEVRSAAAPKAEIREIPEEVQPAQRRRLQSSQVRRARHRGQHNLSAPEAASGRIDELPAVSLQTAQIEDVSERDDAASVSSTRGLVPEQNLDELLAKLADLSPEQARLAASRLLERLLGTQAGGADGRPLQAREPLEQRRQTSGADTTPSESARALRRNEAPDSPGQDIRPLARSRDAPADGHAR